MAGGGGGTTVSRAIESERERGFKKLRSVVRESMGLEILGRGT
jgi:hypothetical protein